MQEAANKGKDAGRCPACGRVSLFSLRCVIYMLLYTYDMLGIISLNRVILEGCGS